MSLTNLQEAALVEAVRDAARDIILPRFRQLPDGAITAKSAPDDLVTIADQQAEVALSEAARRILPDALIVGEEATEDDPSLPEGIGAAPLAVIIDPVDGTWNFASGLSTFGVILAVTAYGDTVFGLLYDPVMDDWILARKGGGAWFCRPDDAPRRLRLPDTTPDVPGGYVSPFLFPEAQREKVATDVLSLGRSTSLRCACHEYRMMALGRSHFCVGYYPKAWDHAAGILVVQEVGGVARHLDGRPYRPGQSAGPLLSALSEDMFDKVQSCLGWTTREPTT